jgi:predicted phage terminase large subunit-like protein
MLRFDDGEEITACDEHRWLTYTAKDMTALTRRTDEFRARRRNKRPSKAGGNKSKAFTASITQRNRERQHVTDDAPSGGLRTTAEIAATLNDGNRANHAVPVCPGLHCPAVDLPLDPYLLGVWLGDGTSRCGAVTTADVEIAQVFETAGFPVRNVQHKPNNAAKSYTFEGLYKVLKSLGVLRNKHVPDAYLWASTEQRIALVQGLMDTDGCVAKSSGSAEFSVVSKTLADAMGQLLRSIGCKATVRESRARLNGNDCGPKYTVKVVAPLVLFRLSRKASVQKLATRRTTRFRFVKSAERVTGVPMRCIQVSASDGMYLAGRGMIPTHNSDALLMAALQYVDHPHYAAILFRRTYADLSLPGALMERAQEWLGGTAAHWSEKTKTWRFPSGATLTFGYLDTDKDRYRYQSAEFQFIGFDELTHFTAEQYRYLFSRLRRGANSLVPIRMRSASNPGGVGHEWVRQRFVDADPANGRAFIPARLEDNPSIDQADYDANLQRLDPVTRAQLRDGDWSVRPQGNMFKREWFRTIEPDDVPSAGMRWVRFWDLAGTADKGTQGQACSAGVLLGMTQEGRFIVADVRRDRLDPAGTQRLLINTASADGRNVAVRQEQEPGSAGKFVVADFATKLAGYDYQGIPATGSKEERARPWSAAAANGLVDVVRGPWNGAYFDELEAFPGEGFTRDQVDASSGGHQYLADRKPLAEYTELNLN